MYPSFEEIDAGNILPHRITTLLETGYGRLEKTAGADFAFILPYFSPIGKNMRVFADNFPCSLPRNAVYCYQIILKWIVRNGK